MKIFDKKIINVISFMLYKFVRKFRVLSDRLVVTLDELQCYQKNRQFYEKKVLVIDF